jgi:hypothetical protein
MDIVVHYILAGLVWGYLLLGGGWVLSLILLSLLSLISGAECLESTERRVNMNAGRCWGRRLIEAAMVNGVPKSPIAKGEK